MKGYHYDCNSYTTVNDKCSMQIYLQITCIQINTIKKIYEANEPPK